MAAEIGERRSRAEVLAALRRCGIQAGEQLRLTSDDIERLRADQEGRAAVVAAEARSLSFFVAGEPIPQGSMVPARNWRKGQPVPENPKVWLRPDNKRTKPWRRELTDIAAAAWNGRPPLAPNVDVGLSLLAVFPHGPSHFSKAANPTVAGGLLPRWAGLLRHRGKPDLDKLTRAVCDSLKVAGVVSDDAQINHYVEPYGKWWACAEAPWGSRPGVHVRLEW